MVRPPACAGGPEDRLIAGNTGGGQSGFLRALDLSHTALMHDELDDAEPEPFDFLAHEREPGRERRVGVWGNGIHVGTG